MATAPIIAIAAVQHRILRAFRQAAATEPARARTLAELRLKENRMFRMMLRDGVIVAAEAGFYLDERRLHDRQRVKKKIALAVVGSVLVFLALVLIMTRR